MIAGCPKCSARYRVDLDQIGEEGAKLRCTKCSAIFMVRAPRPPAAPTPEPVVAAKPTPRVESQVDEHPPERSAEIDPARLVLIADPVEERGKRNAESVEAWGLTTVLVHDGVEAMLAIQRMLPTAVVLDAALPKMFGFQVCEIVKRNESLRHIRVVLVGAIHHQDRYRRDPSDLYGADVYLEQPDLPDGLMPLLREAGMPVSDREMQTDVTTQSAPSVAPTPTPEAPTAPADESVGASAPEPPPTLKSPPDPESSSAAESSVAAPVSEEASELTVERERAERLARIAVSEMLLYQPDKFDQAIRDGNIEAVLDLEIQEARALIRQRISEEVRAERDFILEELERVAQERSEAS